eukprot:COSAG06_NODE_7079_length_2642_cov_3.052300_2_plen_93_part_00
MMRSVRRERTQQQRVGRCAVGCRRLRKPYYTVGCRRCAKPVFCTYGTYRSLHTVADWLGERLHGERQKPLYLHLYLVSLEAALLCVFNAVST